MNEEKHQDPRAFKPERFLPNPVGDGEELSTNAVFGWGRR